MCIILYVQSIHVKMSTQCHKVAYIYSGEQLIANSNILNSEIVLNAAIAVVNDHKNLKVKKNYFTLKTSSGLLVLKTILFFRTIGFFWPFHMAMRYL